MKIIIQVDGKDIALSPADARRIYNELKEVFKDEKPVQYMPSPYPIYYRPWWSVSVPNSGTFQVPTVWTNCDSTTDSVITVGSTNGPSGSCKTSVNRSYITYTV